MAVWTGTTYGGSMAYWTNNISYVYLKRRVKKRQQALSNTDWLNGRVDEMRVKL